ncbi:unnamed protein product [Paramecium pentaurelia]|uniref:Uncharacterized protein n=1 Tax=Paramecium pentaurelia TaxID=43138 RepID=A0A8S1YNI9_9CILI|nr:unnamed protein product [Paramecium pentaurelia]
MNILTSQIQQQKPEILEIVCQIHKREIVAKKVNYNICAVIVQQRKLTITKFKLLIRQKKEFNLLRPKNKKIRQNRFKKVGLLQENTRSNHGIQMIYSQINAQIFTIQKEKQSLLEKCQILHNFQENVKSLSEVLSIDTKDDQMEFQQDSQFIDEIFQQFELLFNNASYCQTIDIFKDAKQKINEINENIKIDIIHLENKNNQKTPSLSRVCPTHNKEIIMIDIDDKNKKMEDRFVCVDCIDDHPKCQYRTIEKVNQQWNHTKNQQGRILNELKLKRQEKQEKLNQQIAIMRKNYNQQLNEISEKLITEFSRPINKTSEIDKFKYSSIQGLSQEELFQNINYLIQYDKENLGQDSKIEYVESKDSLFSKEIESRLEHLKQHDQLDIQESINILQDIQNDNQIQGIVLLSSSLQVNTKVNQEQIIVKQELDELINSSKQLYCQVGLFNQTIQKFQQHLIKINVINKKFKSIPDHLNLKNFEKQVQDYTNNFENDFKQLKKLCEIEKLENQLETLQQDYQKSQQENKQMVSTIEKDYKTKIKDQNVIVDKLKEIEKDTKIKLQNSENENELLNKKLKEELNNSTQKLNELQIKKQQQIQELNNKIGQQDTAMNKIQKELDYKKQLVDPILNLQLMSFLFEKILRYKDIYFFNFLYNSYQQQQKQQRTRKSFQSIPIIIFE